MFLGGGSLAMSNSTVTNNHASLTASLPNSVQLNAVAGGVHVTSSVTAATISNAIISGNSVSMTNTVGDATAFSGGLQSGGPLTLRNTAVSGRTSPRCP
jgi:hypothetical protein